jgi:hypothetical protein
MCMYPHPEEHVECEDRQEQDVHSIDRGIAKRHVAVLQAVEAREGELQNAHQKPVRVIRVIRVY